MKSMLLLVLATAAQAIDSMDQADVTPVQKVIQLLNGMLEKGKAEKQAEEVQFATYKQWCDDTKRQKTAAIREATEQIEVLKADIQMYAAEAEELSKQIAKAEEDITTWNGDMTAATKVREIEKADFDAAHTDYSESVDALDRAIAVLKKQQGDKKQAALLQLKHFDLVPDEAKQRIEAFLAESEDPASTYEAPEANAYEFQSGGVVSLLEKLKLKFEDQRLALEKEEMNSKANYEVLMQQLTNALEANGQDCDKVKQILTYYQAQMARYHVEGEGLAGKLSEEDMSLIEQYAQTQVGTFAGNLEAAVRTSATTCSLPVSAFIPDASIGIEEAAPAASAAPEQAKPKQPKTELSGVAGARAAMAASRARKAVKRQRASKMIDSAVAAEKKRIQALRQQVHALQAEKARLHKK